MKIIMWEGDRFKECVRSTEFDLKCYIDMREKRLRTVLQWEDIKHCHVTEFGRTIWSLTECAFEDLYKKGKPICLEQPTLSFIKEIYEGIKLAKLNSQS